jgi:cell division protein FtsN
MKITSFIHSKKTVLIVFCLTISSIFTACDKIPLFQNEDENNAQDQGIVQTDWNNISEITVEPESPLKKTTAPQPVPDQETNGKIQPVATSQVQNSTEFSVQIGAFLKKENATRLVSKLKAKGYNPSLVVVETPGKRWNLVHVGSYPARKAALTAAHLLTAQENMETAVVKNNIIIKMQKNSTQQTVNLARPKTLKSPIAASIGPARFTFQVGGIRTKENAGRFKKILEKQGYAPYIKKIRNIQNTETWYTVRIGHFDNIEVATDFATRFTAKEQIPTVATSMNE